MRTMRPAAAVAILALILGCALTGCSGGSTGSDSPVVASSGTGSPAATTDPSTPAPVAPTQIRSSQDQAPGLLAYVPSSLAGDCTDNGTSGHLPAVSGYSDSLSCALGWNSPAEIDYYQYDAFLHAAESQAAHLANSPAVSHLAKQAGNLAANSLASKGSQALGTASVRAIRCISLLTAC
jgi:hypothetical protein